MKVEGFYQNMDPVQSGVSQAGNHWQKTYFEIITNEGERSRRVVFGAFGNVVEQVKSLPKGAHVEVKFNAESRDYIDKNGQKRYSTDLMCYGLAVITRQNMQPQYQTPAQQMPQPQTSPEQFQQQYQQTPPPPTAYPPTPPAQGTAAQPQLQYNDSVSQFQQQYQQTPPPPTAYPPTPPAQGTAAQPQLQYNDSVSPFQQQPAASADELPPKNYGLPC